jgi:hypothetical protein
MKRVLKRRLKGETKEDHSDLNNNNYYYNNNNNSNTIGRDGRCKCPHHKYFRRPEKLHFGNYQLFPTKQVLANSDKTKTA